MSYIPTTRQVADTLIKVLPKTQYENLVTRIAMSDVIMPACGGVLEEFLEYL